MADYSGLRPDIALGIKPVQTNIADMVNLASGIQSLQQAQQLNPLQLEAYKLQLQQAQQMNPLLLRSQQTATSLAERTLEPQVSQAASAAKTAETQAQSAAFKLNADQQGIMMQLMTGLEKSPAVLRKDSKAILQDLDAIQRISSEMYGIPVKQNGFMSQARELLAKGNVTGFEDLMRNTRMGMAGTATQTAQLTPALGTVSGMPATFTAGAGPTGMIGVPSGLQGQPTAPAAQPPVTTRPPAQPIVTGEAMGRPAGAPGPTTTMQLPYPVRRANVPYTPSPSEATDLTAGQTYRNNLVNTQSELTTSRRNVEEVITQSKKLLESSLPTSGILGAGARKLSEIAGSEEYKKLSKDLANAQIAQIRTSGGSMDTVAGQQLARLANGDETYPPNVLLGIARRTQADLTDLDMRATAAQKFSQRFGDNNMRAFQQAWQSNADSRVFEIMNLYKEEKDSAVLKREVDKLLGKDAERRKEYLQKYQNIKKLTETGSL